MVKNTTVPINVTNCTWYPRVVLCGSVSTQYEEMNAVSTILQDWTTKRLKMDVIITIPVKSKSGKMEFPELFDTQVTFYRCLETADMVFFFPKSISMDDDIMADWPIETIEESGLKIVSSTNLRGRFDEFLKYLQFGECTSYELATAVTMHKTIVFVMNGKEFV